MVKVFDITNDSEHLIMYGHDNEDGDMAHERVSRLDFGDPFRKHVMMCRYVCKDNVLFVNQDTRKRVLSLVFMIIVFRADIYRKLQLHGLHLLLRSWPL